MTKIIILGAGGFAREVSDILAVALKDGESKSLLKGYVVDNHDPQTGSSVGHDTVLGDFVTVSPGVNIAGNATIESGCYISIGSTIIEGLTIGKGSTIAAGSVITRYIFPFSRVAGSPGRVIRTTRPDDSAN